MNNVCVTMHHAFSFENRLAPFPGCDRRPNLGYFSCCSIFYVSIFVFLMHDYLCSVSLDLLYIFVVISPGFYSVPQFSHCKRCNGNSVCLSVRPSVTRRYCVKTSVVTVAGICNSVGGGVFVNMPPRCRWSVSKIGLLIHSAVNG